MKLTKVQKFGLFVAASIGLFLGPQLTQAQTITILNGDEVQHVPVLTPSLLDEIIKEKDTIPSCDTGLCSLILGHRTFVVTESPGDESTSGAYGETTCESHEMWISTKESNEEKANTIVHEILHAVVCDNPEGALWYNSVSDYSHVGIYHISDVLIPVFRDNPKLLIYLGQLLTKGGKDAPVTQTNLPDNKELPKAH